MTVLECRLCILVMSLIQMCESTRTGLQLTHPAQSTALTQLKSKLIQHRQSKKSNTIATTTNNTNNNNNKTQIAITGTNPSQHRYNSQHRQLSVNELQSLVHQPIHNNHHLQHTKNNNIPPITRNVLHNADVITPVPPSSTPHQSVLHQYIQKFRYAPPTNPNQRNMTTDNISNDTNQLNSVSSKSPFWWQQADIPSQYISGTTTDPSLHTPTTQRRARIDIESLHKHCSKDNDANIKTPIPYNTYENMSIPSTARSAAESNADITELMNNNTNNLYNMSHTRILNHSDNNRSFDSIDDMYSQHSATPEHTSIQHNDNHKSNKHSFNIDIDSIINSTTSKPINPSSSQYTTNSNIDNILSTSQDVDDLLSIWRQQQQYTQAINNDGDAIVDGIMTARTSDTVDMLNSQTISDLKANKVLDILSNNHMDEHTIDDIDTIIRRLRNTNVDDINHTFIQSKQTVPDPIMTKPSPTVLQAEQQLYDASSTNMPIESATVHQLTPLQQAASTDTYSKSDDRLRRILSCTVDGVQFNVNDTTQSTPKSTQQQIDQLSNVKIRISNHDRNNNHDNTGNPAKSNKTCCHCPPVCNNTSAYQHCDHHSCCPLHTHTLPSINTTHNQSEHNHSTTSDNHDLQHNNKTNGSSVDNQSAVAQYLDKQLHDVDTTDHDIIHNNKFDELNHQPTHSIQASTQYNQPTITQSIPPATQPLIQLSMEEMFDQLMRHTLSNTESVDRNLLSNLLQFSVAANQQAKQHHHDDDYNTAVDSNVDQLQPSVEPINDIATNQAVVPDQFHSSSKSLVSLVVSEPTVEPVIPPAVAPVIPSTVQTDQITSMLSMILQSIQQLTTIQQSGRQSIDYTDNTSHAIPNIDDIHSMTSADESLNDHITPTAALDSSVSLPHVQTEQIVSETNIELNDNTHTIIQPSNTQSEPIPTNNNESSIVPPHTQQSTNVAPMYAHQLPFTSFPYHPQQAYIQPTYIPQPVYNPYILHSPYVNALQPSYVQPTHSTYNTIQAQHQQYQPQPYTEGSLNITSHNIHKNNTTAFLPVQEHNQSIVLPQTNQSTMHQQQPLFTDISQFNLNESMISLPQPSLTQNNITTPSTSTRPHTLFGTSAGYTTTTNITQLPRPIPLNELSQMLNDMHIDVEHNDSMLDQSHHHTSTTLQSIVQRSMQS